MNNNASPDILIVDDDHEIRTLLSRYLEEQGFRVSTAGDLRGCNEAMSRRTPDLLVLDVMLPDGSGLDLCRDLWGRRPRVPVILLTALKEDIDRILGLEIGADDYLGKPFNPRELAARIRAVLRRSNDEAETEPQRQSYEFAGMKLDPQLRRVTRDTGEIIGLTGAEFDLLKAFLERSGRLLSRDQLLDVTQGRDRDPADRSIDVLMSRLRRKLGETPDMPIFRTIRNGGYQLVVPVTAVKGEA
ncbi:response regulator transcription factor [Rhizobium sp. B230/85]|uniref:response regulator n=1 Tax=unclassified Rhizobium TaxID=2613769 RepID=UPI001ADCEEC0|nr:MULTISPECIES: response regulator transcription factor [unclassified Rhizobium]MBO9134093.1 response regulator transcription factor [Rhizobium sp. B209b/85]QXZ96776.1 response regulator transcription factor [Rhizobium sp. B230/85]